MYTEAAGLPGNSLTSAGVWSGVDKLWLSFGFLKKLLMSGASFGSVLDFSGGLLLPRGLFVTCACQLLVV